MSRPQGDEDGRRRDLLDDPERASGSCPRVARAVDVPVSVKMRRGLLDGSRTCLDVGPRLVDAGAATLTLTPARAKQMYTGTADHSLTAELVELVDVPVIACGDVTTRARAQQVLATTGAAAVMIGRGAQGNPGCSERSSARPTPSRPARRSPPSDPLHPRDRQEMGERRGSGFLKEVYGWYLGRGRFPRPFKNELVVLDSTDEVIERLLAAPGAAGARRGSRPSSRRWTTPCWSSRSRSTAGVAVDAGLPA